MWLGEFLLSTSAPALIDELPGNAKFCSYFCPGQASVLGLHGGYDKLPSRTWSRTGGSMVTRGLVRVALLR